MKQSLRQIFLQFAVNVRGVERKLLNEIRQNKGGVAAKLSHAGVFALDQEGVCRGLAIGMFWAFIPMPLQMFPAALFCWMCRGNLPLAIVCVWISNPFTYLPIFYAEYKIGVWLFASDAAAQGQLAFSRFSETSIKELLPQILEPLTKGALFLSCIMMCAGYGAGYPLQKFIAKRKRKKNASRAR